MKRIITQKLVNWKMEENRKPLILRGARQIGKTYSVVEFGMKHFNGKLHIVDLEKHPKLIKIFEKDLNPTRILSEIEISIEKKINVVEDLLFIDEVQNSKKALSSLRYFYEEMPELHLIAAGSLIEFALQDISFPVGRVQTITMYPMNFYEYLVAREKEISAEAILASPLNTYSEVLHIHLLDELRNYFFVGGMPEAVMEYIKTEKIRSAFEVQKDLIIGFRQDFSKYAGRSDKKCLNDVFISTAKSVGTQLKYNHLSDGFSIPTIKKAFELLEDANIIYKIYSTSPAGLPLEVGVLNKVFKPLFLDIGLMQQACGLQVGDEYAKDNLLSIYKGALAEQFVGQELLSTCDTELFYWSRNRKSSNAEIDYLIAKKGKIFPIEVKSGPAGKLKSLHLLLQKYKNISNSFVLSTGEYSQLPEQKITFLPLYYAYWLAKS